MGAQFGSAVAGEVEEAIGLFPIQEGGRRLDVMEDFVAVVDSVGSVGLGGEGSTGKTERVRGFQKISQPCDGGRVFFGGRGSEPVVVDQG